MAIAYGGQTNSGVLSNTTSPSFTGPVISGSNPVLLILIANRDGGNLDVNSVLVNGTADRWKKDVNFEEPVRHQQEGEDWEP